MGKETVTASFYDPSYSGLMNKQEDGDYVDRRDGESLAAALLKIINEEKSDVEDWRNRALQLERKIQAITKWLESNQPDVFSRGLRDVINANWSGL